MTAHDLQVRIAEALYSTLIAMFSLPFVQMFDRDIMLGDYPWAMGDFSLLLLVMVVGILAIVEIYRPCRAAA